LICERWARAQIEAKLPGHSTYEWLAAAMKHYGRAEGLAPAGNQDAGLRWNACVRTLAQHPELGEKDVGAGSFGGPPVGPAFFCHRDMRSLACSCVKWLFVVVAIVLGCAAAEARRIKKSARPRLNMPPGWTWPPSAKMKADGQKCLAQLTELGVKWEKGPA